MAAAAAVGVLGIANGAAGQCQYEVTTIWGPGCPSGPTPIVATGINELGDVVGFYYHCGGSGDTEAFRWSEHTGIVTLPRPAGVSSALASDLNDAGVIVGTYTRTGVGFRAFVYQGGVFTELPPDPPGLWSGASAVNNSGQVVGHRSTGEGDPVFPHEAFIWSEADGFLDLGVMNGPASSASDVNGDSAVVGWTGNGGSVSEAYLWENGSPILLGSVPGGFTSRPYALSANGILVGDGRIPMEGSPVGAPRAFRWQEGQFTMLGTLPGHAWSRAHDVSPDGLQVVGNSWNVDGDPSNSHAFIWQSGVITDLNELIPSDLNITVTGASAINASGVIVGVAHDAFGNLLFVVLEPVEPIVGDVDSDCEVDVADLIILLDSFGDVGVLPADLNDDGVVDVLDLILLLLNISL